MKAHLLIGLLAGLFFILPGRPARGEDLREANAAFAEKKAAVIEQMEAEKIKARQEAEETRRRIISDQAALSKAVKDLETEILALERENQDLEKRLEDMAARENDLKEGLSDSDRVLGELMGGVRAGARDLKALLDQSLQTALDTRNLKKLEALGDQTVFPSMVDIQDMVEIYFTEMQRAGEVRVEKAPFISPSGEEVEGDILVLGNFTAAYGFKGETGFLDHSPHDQKLSALVRSPGRSLKNKIQAYMEGKSEGVPVDISRGGALRQLIHKTSLLEKIPLGGPIVWPIIAIAFLALILVIERIYFLVRHNPRAAEFMDQIHAMADSGNWDPCREFCRKQKQNPLARVLLSGMAFMHMQREDMENAIQETILREIPPFEKYLSTLGMLAAIEPLLGLLGTVTGMINTFHVITFYGTGDPRMMSSGISEALVTTMLGLMAAIPILFAHTLLSGRVEQIIGEMEEKAISFTNLVFKTRGGA